jgi:Skp family chaperone for outer membrane proteins
LGLVAQDFQAAFSLGLSDKSIATVDADGVALAAIQGLNQKVDSESAALRAENAELRRELNAIKAALEKLTTGQH